MHFFDILNLGKTRSKLEDSTSFCNAFTEYPITSNKY